MISHPASFDYVLALDLQTCYVRDQKEALLNYCHSILIPAKKVITLTHVILKNIKIFHSTSYVIYPHAYPWTQTQGHL
jgi:hypothetical protein